MKVTDLSTSEYNSFYKTYINKVPKKNNLIDGYNIGMHSVVDFFKSIPENKLEYRYSSDKWSIKEVFQHIIDTERVFIYRCFAIARNDKTTFPGFEQNDYIKPSNADNKTIDSLLEEYKAVRSNSIVLLNSLSNDDLKFLGHVSGNPMSARAAAFIIIGHEIHHIEVIKSRYIQ